MLSEIIHIMEYTLYIYLSVSVGYIVLFSAASHFFKQKKYPATTVRQRFIILVPAYKEDAVIHACVTSVLRQTYPAELYDLIVISDHMRPETNAIRGGVLLRKVFLWVRLLMRSVLPQQWKSVENMEHTLVWA